MPKTNKWSKKLWYINNGKLCNSKKKTKSTICKMQNAASWMEQEYIILCEVSQKKTVRWKIITQVWDLKIHEEAATKVQRSIMGELIHTMSWGSGKEECWVLG